MNQSQVAGLERGRRAKRGPAFDASDDRRWRAGRRFLTAWVVTSFLVATSATAWSAPLRPGRIALLDPLGSSPTARQYLTRIRAELTAGGFDVAIVDAGPGLLDPVSVAAVMQQQAGTIATIALVGDPDRPGAELWILDRVGETAEVRRIPIPTADEDHPPEVLAIRTIEVLKASALKVLVEATRARPDAGSATVAIASSSPTATEANPGVVALEAGLAMVANVSSLGPAAVPVGRVRARLGSSAFARLTLAGLGSRPRVATALGSASVAQNLGLAELVVALRPGARLRPTFSLGAGALYVQTDGEGVWPYRGLRQTRWAAALDAGIGLLASVNATLTLGFEIHALVALPHPTVRLYDVETGAVGFPAILASLTMMAWL
ncbi:MAG TPA: hypothetical protein VHU40_22505 [Polyangia bacterium]|nr:hypothetical protein [Polyangia bacterium]